MKRLKRVFNYSISTDFFFFKKENSEQVEINNPSDLFLKKGLYNHFDAMKPFYTVNDNI